MITAFSSQPHDERLKINKLLTYMYDINYAHTGQLVKNKKLKVLCLLQNLTGFS